MLVEADRRGLYQETGERTDGVETAGKSLDPEGQDAVAAYSLRHMAQDCQRSSAKDNGGDGHFVPSCSAADFSYYTFEQRSWRMRRLAPVPSSLASS